MAADKQVGKSTITNKQIVLTTKTGIEKINKKWQNYSIHTSLKQWMN
jgi:hypothetical protein